MKQSTYLETSVIGAYLDNGEPFRRDLTIRWWEHELSEYRAVISPLVNRELERVSEPHRSAYLNLIRNLEQVELTEEAAILAEGYISRGIFHRKYMADALHVAVAREGALEFEFQIRDFNSVLRFRLSDVSQTQIPGPPA